MVGKRGHAQAPMPGTLPYSRGTGRWTTRLAGHVSHRPEDGGSGGKGTRGVTLTYGYRAPWYPNHPTQPPSPPIRERGGRRLLRV